MSIRESKENISKLNVRFVKDYSLSIDKGIASITSGFFDRLFLERLEQYNYYEPGIIDKYNTFITEIEGRFETVEEYYQYRNKLANDIITELCNNEDKYNYSGNNGAKTIKERFPQFKSNISSKSYLKENNLGKTLISFDLKSANFTALKFFDKNIVNNKETYDDFISEYTNLSHIRESKYFRQRIFGKAGVSQQVQIEKSITGKVLEILLKYIGEEYFLTFSHDELVFEKTDDFEKKLPNILSEINLLKIQFHLEEFNILKIEGITDGYIKKGRKIILNEDITRIYGVSSMMYPFVLSSLYKIPVKVSYNFFKNQEGFLSEFIEIPKIEIRRNL